MTLRTSIYGLVLLVPLGLAGCDSKPPPLVAVHGRVTLFDASLRSGTVVFTPDAERGTYGPHAVGTIGPDGQYALLTDGSPGVTPGWHRVTVACLQPPVGSRIPERYQDPQLSGLRAEVRVGVDNVFDWRLEAP
jgi:hypothetical protein